MKKYVIKKQKGGNIFDKTKLNSEQLNRYNSLDDTGKMMFEEKFMKGSIDDKGNAIGTTLSQRQAMIGTGIGVAGTIASEAIGEAEETRERRGKAPSVALESSQYALKRAGQGAALGSVIPGVGTAIGAGVGAVEGMVEGAIRGSKEKEDYKEEQDKQEKEEVKNRLELQKLRQSQYQFKKGGKVMKKYGQVVSKEKARMILHDKTIHGKPITEKQRKFFGAQLNKAEGGTIIKPKNLIEKQYPYYTGMQANEGEYAKGGKCVKGGIIKKAKNFSSGEAYKKWLSYGHMHGAFKKSPGNTPVKIKGKAHKVKHAK